MSSRNPENDPNTTTPYEGDEGVGTRLLVLEDERVRTVVLPEQATLVIGRAEDSDVRIDSSSISRRHAILRVGESLTLEDVGSSNGTRIGGRVIEPHRPFEVSPGELIELGKVALLIQTASGPHGDDTAAPASPNVDEGADDRMQRLQSVVDRVAQSEISVLVLGETGVGKEVLARRIHANSPRSGGPFVALNCAAFSEQLLDSELFGYEAGAFTGARQTKPGLLETAQGGTIFLDEVGELPLAAQVKLLRVLEERQVLRVGGLATRPIDVRFISATNRSLGEEVARGRFRQDLFFRLNGISLTIPPLRQRAAEVPVLATSFVEESCRKAGRVVLGISPQAMESLLRHDWPGNVRELKNVIERAVVLCSDPAIGPEHLMFEASEAVLSEDAPARGDDERARIAAALQQCAGNQTRAAKMLGISRKTLGIKMDRYGIARPQKGRP